MKLLKNILYILTVILIIFPIGLYVLGVNQCKSLIEILQKCCWQYYMIGLGGIVVVICLILVHNESTSFKPYKYQIWYFLKNGRPAWILGLAFSNIIVALYFLIPFSIEVDRFNTSFGVFLGILAIFLGFHFLYENEAPLIGTKSLLERLILDLKKFEGGDLRFVFPALNLGFYTEEIQENKINYTNRAFHEDPRTLSSSLYFQLERIIRVKGNVIKSTRKAIIYNDTDTNNQNFLEKMYMAYHYMIKNKADCQSNINNKNHLQTSILDLRENSDVLKCIESARLISELFNDDQQAIIKKVSPNKMIQPVIVVDDIVYLIADYGMPIYDSFYDIFVPLKEEGKPVDLICWRRQDKLLARQIVNHINRFIDTY